MKRKVSIFISILILILLDQAVKGYVVKEIPLGGMRRFIPKVVSLTYLKNSGAAFSMLENQQWFFTIITLIAMGAAFVYLYRHIKGSIWLLLGLTVIICRRYVPLGFYEFCHLQCSRYLFNHRCGTATDLSIERGEPWKLE